MDDDIIFGKWMVIDSKVKFDSTTCKLKIKCKCECGTLREVIKASLLNGKSTNCGCVRKKLISERNTSHGNSNHELYIVWKNMKARCFNKGSYFFHRYGGRGITVCKEWKADFSSFYNWSINNGYKIGLQVDRIDNNGNYNEENCRFVTKYENCQNRSTSKITIEDAIEIKSELYKKASEIAQKFGISVSMVNSIRRCESWKNAQMMNVDTGRN